MILCQLVELVPQQNVVLRLETLNYNLSILRPSVSIISYQRAFRKGHESMKVLKRTERIILKWNLYIFKGIVIDI